MMPKRARDLRAKSEAQLDQTLSELCEFIHANNKLSHSEYERAIESLADNPLGKELINYSFRVVLHTLGARLLEEAENAEPE